MKEKRETDDIQSHFKVLQICVMADSVRPAFCLERTRMATWPLQSRATSAGMRLRTNTI